MEIGTLMPHLLESFGMMMMTTIVTKLVNLSSHLIINNNIIFIIIMTVVVVVIIIVSVRSGGLQKNPSPMWPYTWTFIPPSLPSIRRGTSGWWPVIASRKNLDVEFV
jgi:hypothetical protein